MKLKTLTKTEVEMLRNPLLNNLWGIDELVYQAQLEGRNFIDINRIVPKEVSGVFKSSPFNFSIDEENVGTQNVLLKKITFYP